MVEFTREEYNIIAERRGVEKPQNMSTKKLINTLNRSIVNVKVKNHQK